MRRNVRSVRHELCKISESRRLSVRLNLRRTPVEIGFGQLSLHETDYFQATIHHDLDFSAYD